MEHRIILNLLNEANNYKLVKRKWNIVNDNSRTKYDVGSKIIYNTEILKSNICDYNDAYISVRGNITIIGHQVTQLAFKNCAPLIKYITKNDETTIDDAEDLDLDLVMLIYKLMEYSSICSETTRSLALYKDKTTDFNADIASTNDFKFFMYKAKLLENKVADGAKEILKNATIVVPLKYLSNFWRSPEMPLINCKVKLKLKWTKYCVFSPAGVNNRASNNIIFTIKDTRLYIPVVTYQQKTIKNYQNYLAKDLKDQFIGMNIKQKVIMKIRQTNLDFFDKIFSNKILLESIDCLFYFIQIKAKMLKELVPENIIYQII